MGERRNDDGHRMFNLVRDWTLFVIGCAIIVAEAAAQIGWGHSPDGLIIGTAVALAGGSLVLQKEKS